MADQGQTDQGQTDQGQTDQGQTDQGQTDQPSNLAKDPDEWTTGDEPMTDAQASYIGTMAAEAGEEAPKDLTKADASKVIEDLQEKTGRGGSPKRG